MAFNPFHKFRKHQKVIFACLTIFCMFSFVACSGLAGGGDLAHWLQNLFLGKVKQGEVASLYGSSVTQRELVDLARQRQIAQIYMTEATKFALQNRMEELRPPGADQRMTGEMWTKIFTDPDVIKFQTRLRRPLFFGGSLKTEGLLEFKIWLHKADELGIRLSKGDVANEIKRLTRSATDKPLFNLKTEAAAVEAALRQQFRDSYDPEILVSSLANEFRAQLAQAAILGADVATITDLEFPIPGQVASAIQIPTAVTPDEFWAYFKENQTKIDVRLLPVKVEDYLAQVKEQPTDKELRDLYQKYRDREYAPEAKEPGFKQPHRVQVEWIAGKWESPFYSKAAANYKTALQAAQLVGFGAANRTNADGVAPALDLTITSSIDPLVVAEYERVKYPLYQAASYVRPWIMLSSFMLHEANRDRADNLAAAVGAGAGDLAPVSAIATLLGTSVWREAADRLERGATWLLAGTQPTPMMAFAVGGALTPKSEYLPFAEVKDRVVQRLMPFLAQDILANNLRTIQKEVENRGKNDKDRATLAEYIAKMAKEYDLKTGKTTEARDLYKSKIADDPGLKPLKDAYTRPPSPDPTGKRFADVFLGRDSKPIYTVERLPQSPFRQPDDDSEWRSAPESFLFWKTEDRPARTVPFDDAEVKKEVERAWRMQKARELAKKDAEQLATKAREEKGDVRKLRDFAARQNKDLIELPSLAKKMQMPSFRAEIAYLYQLPKISEDKVPYADAKDRNPDGTEKPSEFATKLLTLQEKVKGDTLVVPDYPENVYYVAVLVDKREPTMDEFFTVYRDGSTDAIRRNPLLQDFEREKQVAYYKSVVELLRKEAKLEVKEKTKEAEANLVD